MRKRILDPTSDDTLSSAASWLDLDELAEVELTSEDKNHPVEAALRPGGGAGWRAAAPGEQVIRLRFDAPQRLQRIRLVFHEREVARTQEFTLRWSADGGQSYREVVRQQFNFSPPGTTSEVEDLSTDLEGVSALELSIIPDVSGGDSRASLAELRIA